MKFFEKLTKASRIIFIIGAFVYAALYATFHAGGMGNTFMSVLVGLIYLIVGTGLLVAAPLLLLFKRDEAAKYVYLVLLGYWLLSTVQTYLNQADIASNSNDALTVVIGIFSFILGLALVGIIVLVALEYFISKSFFRFISFLIFVGVVGFALVTAILLIVQYARYNAGWTTYVSVIMNYFIAPATLCFGYLHFFGAPKRSK